MKVLVTGSEGFVGKNLVAFLKTKEDISVYECDINTTENELEEYCNKCDFVVNLAGVNRTNDSEEFIVGNLGVVQKVVEYLNKFNNNVPILLSSSTHALKDNDYGRSKKLAENFVLDYAKKSDTQVYIYRFTNIFGKWSKPNYNTVIATFCYNISHGIPIIVNDVNTVLELCYIDDVVQEIYKTICGKKETSQDCFYKVPITYTKKLGEIVDLLNKFKETRENLSLINTADEFEKKLYSTYLSFLPENSFKYGINTNMDNRGSFTELIRTSNSGQFSVNIAKPGVTKGNHWHNTKNEKFVVVKGNAVLKFRKPFEKEVVTVNVSGDKIEVVDIPCGYTHSIKNIGNEDLVFFIWCNECFSSENPDTYYLEV